MADLSGHTLQGRYEVQEFLGRGGMADVYRVWDRRRAVYLAMKVLRQELALDKVFLNRFKREARVLAHLQHPHIVRFYELGQDGYLAFILMDYIEGRTLKHEISDARQSVAPGRIREIMRPVCSALNFAHSQGLVHCDVKPANIMLHRNGAVLVTDFGIARMTNAAMTTMVGAGTPAYMAPEQVKGREPAPQTDIYALGLVLYELLTGGQRPFTGEQAQITGSTGEKVRWEQLHWQPPPPRIHNPDISAELDTVVMRCLAKEPAERFPSTLRLLEAAEKALDVPRAPPLRIPAATSPSTPEAHPAPVHRRPAFSPIWIVGAVAVVALLTGVILLGSRKPPDPGSGVAQSLLDRSTQEVVQPLPTETLFENARVVQEESQPQPVSQTYPVNACMAIDLVAGVVRLDECVTGITILPDGKMQIDFSWTARIEPGSGYSVEKGPDTGNRNMYLVDNLGNRLDHTEAGGAAAGSVMLGNDETAQGWFLFPELAPDARSFVFYDDDNGISTPPILRQWP